MKKIKRIIFAASISLVLLITCNIFIGLKDKNSYIEIPIATQMIIKGKLIKKEDIKWVRLKQTNDTKNMYKDLINSNIIGKISNSNIEKGQIVIKQAVISKELKSSEDMSYVSIPITNQIESIGNNVEKGSVITVYYTAKRRLVSEILKNKERVYGSDADDALVTSKLLDRVEVFDVVSNLQTNNDGITAVVIHAKNEDAMLIANLKSQGNFYIALN